MTKPLGNAFELADGGLLPTGNGLLTAGRVKGL